MNSSISIEATVKQLRRRSKVTGVLALLAAGAVLLTTFLTRGSYHFLAAIAPLAASLLAAIATVLLQLSKKRVEQSVIASATTASFPLTFTPKAMQSIRTLDADTQIRVLEFLRCLSADPEQAVTMARRLPNHPDGYESRLGERCSVIWKIKGQPLKEILVLGVFGAAEHNITIDSDYVVPV